MNHSYASILPDAETHKIDNIDIIRRFPKVDHLGIDVRIVLEQNEFNKKGTSDRT